MDITAATESDRVPDVFQAQAEELTGARIGDAHAHHWAQISLPTTHALTVIATGRALVVAPMTAVWMPAGMVHQPYVEQSVHIYNMRVNPNLVPTAPKAACTFQMTPFVHELLLHMAAIGSAHQQSAYGQKLLEILIDTIIPVPPETVSMRMPCDRRLRTIARSILVDPTDERSLEDWSQHVGASYRTLARHFVRETGLTFQEWRQTVRIIRAMKMLSSGVSVCHVASEFGYASAGGFATMFKRITGRTPSDFARVHDSQNPRFSPPGYYSQASAAN